MHKLELKPIAQARVYWTTIAQAHDPADLSAGLELSLPESKRNKQAYKIVKMFLLVLCANRMIYHAGFNVLYKVIEHLSLYI